MKYFCWKKFIRVFANPIQGKLPSHFIYTLQLNHIYVILFSFSFSCWLFHKCGEIEYSSLISAFVSPFSFDWMGVDGGGCECLNCACDNWERKKMKVSFFLFINCFSHFLFVLGFIRNGKRRCIESWQRGYTDGKWAHGEKTCDSLNINGRREKDFVIILIQIMRIYMRLLHLDGLINFNFSVPFHWESGRVECRYPDAERKFNVFIWFPTLPRKLMTSGIFKGYFGFILYILGNLSTKLYIS